MPTDSQEEKNMRAVLVRAPGGPEQLVMGVFPRPEPGPHEVRVAVRATALNRADLLQREGRYPPPEGASPLLGLEMAGVVEAVGPGVTARRVGDAVCGLLPGGGYAEYVVLHEDLAMPIPDGLTFEDAAAVPEAFLTAYQALHWLGRLAPGETVLVHAGASGVGTAAIQLARAAGATVYVTASAGKHALCLDLGTAAAIDYRTEDFAARVRDLTSGRGADVVLDFLGASYLAKNVEALALDGRIVLLATMGGALAERFDMRPFFRKRATLAASTLRNRSLDYKAALTRAFAAEALPRLADGTLRPIVDRVFDWTDAAAAHRCMEENRNAGKIVLRVSG